MKPGENISQIQTQFTHIASHMRPLGKTFSNEELIIKILRCLNRSCPSKVIAICETKDLTTMETHTLFGKLQEHGMKLKRLSIDEEGEKKNKSLTLKVEESDSDGDMALIVNNFKRFMKNEKNQKKEKGKDEEKTPFILTCYNRENKGHVKPYFPSSRKKIKNS